MSACTMWPGRRTLLPLRACACRRQRSRAAGTTGARDAGGATDAYYMGPAGPSTVTRTDGAVHACMREPNKPRTVPSHPMTAHHHLQHTYWYCL
jgi:hypothetical protein